MTQTSQTARPEHDRFPSQARYVLGNEAAERYSYYGMKGILALYITNVLIMSQDDATQIIHLFSFVNYFMPILGAWVSERYWGRYKTILWISLSYCAGHGVLALSDAFDKADVDAKTICLYAGLGLIAFGAGGIKPCVSAFMGDQFGPERRHLLPRAYAAFYWSINLGSTAAFLTIPYIRKEWGYSWAFGVPGIAMAVATFVFWLGTSRYVMVPPSSKTKSAGFFKVLFSAISEPSAGLSESHAGLVRRPSKLLAWSVLTGLFMEGIVFVLILWLSARIGGFAYLLLPWAVGVYFETLILRALFRLKRGRFSRILRFVCAFAALRGAYAFVSAAALLVYWSISWYGFARAVLGDSWMKSFGSLLEVAGVLLLLLLLLAWAALALVRAYTAVRGGLLAAQATSRVLQPSPHESDKSRSRDFWTDCSGLFTKAEIDAARSVGPVLMIFALAPVFWALFDQTFSTWVLQGEMMRPAYLRAADFKPSDVRNPQQFLAQARSGTNAVMALIWEAVPESDKTGIAGAGDSGPDLPVAVAGGLNALLAGGSLFRADVFDTNSLSPETLVTLRAPPEPEVTARVNRLLIEDTFPDAIVRSYRIGPEEMLSANPIFVMIFVPIMSLLVYPLLGRFATPLKRMSTGMFLAAGSFVIVAWLQTRIDGGEQLSILWQTLPYVVLTIAEVLFSTTGLEFAFREAAPSMKSIITGFWYLAVALGNLFVTVVTGVAQRVVGGGAGGHEVAVTPRMFLFYAGLTFVVAIAFSVIASFYRYRDSEAAKGR